MRDAHDRYANIGINFLLQKIEEHEGIVILSTNLSENIDEPFLRRMDFIVDFKSPTSECSPKEVEPKRNGLYPSEIVLD